MVYDNALCTEDSRCPGEGMLILKKISSNLDFLHITLVSFNLKCGHKGSICNGYFVKYSRMEKGKDSRRQITSSIV